MIHRQSRRRSSRVPASRPTWKGYIKLALVSCPIALWPATAPGERITFRQINKKTGNRIRQQSVDEGTREPVDLKDKGKGYEIDKDQYILVDDDELKSIPKCASWPNTFYETKPLRSIPTALSTATSKPLSSFWRPRGRACQISFGLF